jgi:tetratricopeptide (TPR) repeat protein
LGRIAQERDDFEQAEQLLREALAFYQGAGDERLSYFLTANLADVALEQGDLNTAWALCDDVLPSVRRAYEPELAGLLMTVLGRVARQRGDLQQAKVLFEEVLGTLHRMDEIANILLDLAQIEIQLDQIEEARPRLLKALEIYRRLDIQSRVQEIEELLTALPLLVGQE